LDNVSISELALVELREWMDRYAALADAPDVPKLCFYGRRLEHHIADNVVDVVYFDAGDFEVGTAVGEIEGGHEVLFYSDVPLDKGMHFIDWVDGELRLTSVVGGNS
jgi:hypothetical protein